MRVLGIDLGGTHIRVGVVSEDFKVLFWKIEESRVHEGPKALVERIKGFVEETRDFEISGIGFGCAGFVNHEKEMLISSPNFPLWRNVPLGKYIREETGLPTFLVNDATALAFGEHIESGEDDFLCVTIGTGIGGGIVLSGKPYLGKRGMAAEIGHITVEPYGITCLCGNNGCLEAYASAKARERKAKALLASGKRSSLLDEVLGDISKVTAEMITRHANLGDKLCKDVIYESAVYLGIGIANVMNILDIYKVFLGGGACEPFPFIEEVVRDIVEKRAVFPIKEGFSLKKGKGGQKLGVIGAAGIFFKRYGNHK